MPPATLVAKFTVSWVLSRYKGRKIISVTRSSPLTATKTAQAQHRQYISDPIVVLWLYNFLKAARRVAVQRPQGTITAMASGDRDFD